MKQLYFPLTCLTILLFTQCTKDDNDDNNFNPSLPASCNHLVQFLDTGARLTMPTAFTPNGDGINDRIRPLQYLDDTTNYHFAVTNLDGDLVFQSNSILDSWDGTDFTGSGDTLYRVSLRFTMPSTQLIDTCSYIYKLPVTNNNCVYIGTIDPGKLVFPDMVDISTLSIVHETAEVFCP